MIEAPCKDCPRKGCGSYHDKCTEFKKYKEEADKIKREKQERLRYEMDYRNMAIENCIKRNKDRTRLKQR